MHPSFLASATGKMMLPLNEMEMIGKVVLFFRWGGRQGMGKSRLQFWKGQVRHISDDVR